jgi:branched-chain amino acid transport system ATP-binding protein
MISVKNLSKNFGGIKAVNNASLVIKKGSITGLIGPNGAGKTTLFNVIAGVYPPSHGTVFLEDEDITQLPPHELFNRGLMRTFQIAHEFSSLTVRENLMMVPANQSGEKLIDIWLRPSKIKLEEEQIVEKANNVMDFLQLSALADEFAGNLSGGQKKLLELGRTMMVEPKIVFLD